MRDGRLDRPLDRLMIGLVIAGDSVVNLRRREADIARHDQPVGDLHQQRGVVEAAIGVDQQPREAGQDRRRPEQLGQPFGHGGGAEVVGDVAVKVLRLQAQRAIGLGNRVLGVIAEDEEACARVALDEAVRLDAQFFLLSIQTSLHAVPVLSSCPPPTPCGKKKA